MSWVWWAVGWTGGSLFLAVILGTVIARIGRADRAVLAARSHGVTVGAPPAVRPTKPDESQVPTVAVHGLLASLEVVVGGLSTLDADWPHLDNDERVAIIARTRDQAEFASGLLVDFLRELPSATNDALDDLRGAALLSNES